VHLSALERVFTRHFLPATLGSLAIAWVTLGAIVYTGGDLDDLSQLVDSAFKVAAVIVGTSWALNRYFTARTDVLQLRVEPTVDTVGQPAERLLVCRLDIVNTGRSLTPTFREWLEIEAASRNAEAVTYMPIFRWPEQGDHRTAPIEPGSWSAISIAVPLPLEVNVVRIYLELDFADGTGWTWHRHFTTERTQNAKQDT